MGSGGEGGLRVLTVFSRRSTLMFLSPRRTLFAETRSFRILFLPRIYHLLLILLHSLCTILLHFLLPFYIYWDLPVQHEHAPFFATCLSTCPSTYPIEVSKSNPQQSTMHTTNYCCPIFVDVWCVCSCIGYARLREHDREHCRPPPPPDTTESN